MTSNTDLHATLSDDIELVNLLAVDNTDVPEEPVPVTENEPLISKQLKTEDDPDAWKKGTSPNHNDDESIRTGSVLNAIFNFTNAPMGSGLLAFPYAFYCTGLLLGVVIIIIILVLQLISLHVLVLCSFKRGGIRSYQDCVEIYLGKYWKKFIEIVMMIYVTGICVGYLAVLGQFIKPVMEVIVNDEYSLFVNQKFIIVVFATFVVFPLTFLREIKKLGFTSLLALAGALYLASFVTFTGVMKIFQNNVGKGVLDELVMNTEKSFGFYPLFFLAIPLECFCYQSQVLLFPITYEVKRGTVKKIDVVAFVSTCIVTLVYVSNGLFGYISFGKDVQDNIMLNFRGDDLAANICRFGCGLNVILSYPVQSFAGRSAITSLLFRKNELKTFGHVVLCFVYFLFNLLLALFVPGISTVFSFIGAFGAVSLMYFFPALLLWKELSKNVEGGRKFMVYGLAILFFIVAVFFCVTGIIASIFDFLSGIDIAEYF